MSEKKYWHKLTKAEQAKVTAREKYTLSEFMEEYSQPDWCEYTDALEAMMGCWSLFYGHVHSEKTCKKCECYKKPEEVQE